MNGHQTQESPNSLVRTSDAILNSLPSILITLDRHQKITRWNLEAERIFGINTKETHGKILESCISIRDGKLSWFIEQVFKGSETKRLQEVRFTRPNGEIGTLSLCISTYPSTSPSEAGVMLIAEDTTDQDRLKQQMGQTQKLESIGQLAAGIAHEINTPMQFIGDNARFIQESFEQVASLLTAYEQLYIGAHEQSLLTTHCQTIAKLINKIEPEFLMEEVPGALDDSIKGIEAVSNIVLALKRFAHPGSDEKKSVNVNDALHNTLAVSKNEWKYAANLTLKLDPDLPTIHAHPGELNQVFLNLLVNAAHAIEDVVGTRPELNAKGQITIETITINDYVEIRISDTGTGIPESIKAKIFDPFFTTKEVGKGTGQGLAITHSVIVQKHGGRLKIETQVGHGTTFVIQLPATDSTSSKH